MTIDLPQGWTNRFGARLADFYREPDVLKQAEQTAKPVPGNHSPLFAPLIEPTLTTGVEALNVDDGTHGPARR